MKRFIKYLVIAGLVVGTFFVLHAANGAVSQYWQGGTGTSTIPITGQFLGGYSSGTLKCTASTTPCWGPWQFIAGLNITLTTSTVGQLTIAGSAGGGGIASSTPVTSGTIPMWSGTNALTNSPIYQAGGIVQIPNLNTALYVSSTFAGDFGTNVNNLYASKLNIASSVTIIVPSITVPAVNWKVPINFNNNDEQVNFICPGGANLIYGGAGAAVTFNFGNPTGHIVSQDYGCTYMGSSTLLAAGAASAATSTGIVFGGANGAVGIDFHDNSINGFGSCVDVATNTYMFSFRNNAVSGCGTAPVASQPYPGSLITFNKASNSGERMIVSGNSFTDPTNSTSNYAIYFSDNGNNSSFFQNNSVDDASIYVGISSAMVDIGFNHFENSAVATYPGYYFIIASSSGSTNLDVHDNLFANDGTTAANNSRGIEHAVNLSFNHNEVNKYGTQTITNFINHDINNGQAVEEACNNWSQNTAVSNWMQLTGTTYPGCFYENSNSYPIIWTQAGNNLATFTNGQQTVISVDNNGNTNFPVSGSMTSVQKFSASSTATFAANASVLGIASTSQLYANSSTIANLVDSGGNKYSTSTSSGTGSVSTSSPITAKYLPYWATTSGGLNGTSSIYQASANNITLASTSDNGLFSVVNASNTLIFQIASTTGNAYKLQVASATQQLWGVSAYGHVNSSGTVPAVTGGGSTCGTSAPTIVGTDYTGIVTVGSGSGTSCVVTFAKAYKSIPVCFGTDATTKILTLTSATPTAVTIAGVFVAGDNINYQCTGID